MVPGVSVMELARHASAASLFKGVRNLQISGSWGRLGLRMNRQAVNVDLTISTISTPR